MRDHVLVALAKLIVVNDDFVMAPGRLSKKQRAEHRKRIDEATMYFGTQMYLEITEGLTKGAKS